MYELHANRINNYIVHYVNTFITFISIYNLSNYLGSELIIKIKRGIVDECCSVPCKRRFLKDNYCAPEPQMYVIFNLS